MNLWRRVVIVVTALVALQISFHCCVAALGRRPYLDAVQLNVYDGKYVYIMTGHHHGRALKYKLDFATSEIIIHTSLVPVGQTFAIVDPEHGEGTESFYFYDTELRLPFRQAPPNDDLFYNNYQGTLGLGRGAPLWRYWRNFTLTQNRLKLGTFDRYAREDPTWLGPQIGLDVSGKTRCTVDGKEYDFEIDTSRLETTVPDHVYRRAAGRGSGSAREIVVALKPKYRNCTAQYIRWGLSARDPAVRGCANEQALTLLTTDATPLDGMMTFGTLEGEVAGTRFRFGKSAMDKIVLFVDYMTNDIVLAPFALSISHIEFLWLICLIVALLLIFWLLGMDGGNAGHGGVNLVLVLSNFFLYAICIVLYINNVVGFEASQFLSSLISDNAVVFIVFIGIFTGAFTVASVYLMFFYRGEKRSWLNAGAAQRLLMLTVVLYNIWLSMVISHQSTIDLLYMLFVLTILCIVSITTTLTILLPHILLHKQNDTEPWAFSILGITLVAFAFLVLIRCNLMPLLDMVVINFKVAIIVLYCFYVIVVPSLYFLILRKNLNNEHRMNDGAATLAKRE